MGEVHGEGCSYHQAVLTSLGNKVLGSQAATTGLTWPKDGKGNIREPKKVESSELQRLTPPTPHSTMQGFVGGYQGCSQDEGLRSPVSHCPIVGTKYQGLTGFFFFFSTEDPQDIKDWTHPLGALVPTLVATLRQA